jgi:sirohydrochlorin ferrochelatase
MRRVKAILLIDHGSRRSEANEMLHCMANLVQRMAGPAVLVRHAHMELAEPSVEAGVRSCIEGGATEIIAFPYMLSPGRHSTSDIPRLVSEAAQAYPGVQLRVTPAFGIEAELGDVILRRAGIPVMEPVETADACVCWQPDGRVGICGDACAVHAVARATPSSARDSAVAESPSPAPVAGGRT